MVLIVNKPTYSKLNGEPCHTFRIETDQTLSGISEVTQTSTPISVLNEMIKEHSDAFQQFLNAFLEATVKYFAKAYTVDAISNLLSHEVRGSTDALTVPSHVVYTPVEMTITKGSFLLSWTFSQEPALIAIPDEVVSQSQSQSVKPAPKETNTLWVKQPYEFGDNGDILL